MRELFRDYWDKIAKSPLYWIPLVVFSFVGFGFSICNRTIHGDDLLKDYYNSIAPFSGRWGMLVWSKLVGVTDLFPFVDRFTALLFLLAASFLIGVLFYYLNNRSDSVLSYTVLSSMILTFPLINEIFEYTSADFQYTGNLALVIFAFIYLTLKRGNPSLRVILIASIIMILPASSYEVAVFSYITLLCAVILFKHILLPDKQLTFKEWLCDNVYYLSPLLLAVIFRFFVHYAILFVCNASYIQLGGSDIDYNNITLSYIVGSNIFKYYIAGLVYFPITVFVVISAIFVGYIIHRSIKYHCFKLLLLAALLYGSIFLLVIRGSCMDYRIAQTVTIFVAFVSFLICEMKCRMHKLRIIIPICILFLCWHQAVFINKILSLNNMRSNNEMGTLRSIGNRIISDYGKNMRVLFVVDKDASGGYLGPWIEKRVHADLNTWNGQLFDRLVKKYLPEKYHHYKYINSNVNNVLNWSECTQIKDFFAYCGYDINVITISSALDSVDDPTKRDVLKKTILSAIDDMQPLEMRHIDGVLLVKYFI